MNQIQKFLAVVFIIISLVIISNFIPVKVKEYSETYIATDSAYSLNKAVGGYQVSAESTKMMPIQEAFTILKEHTGYEIDVLLLFEEIMLLLIISGIGCKLLEIKK